MPTEQEFALAAERFTRAAEDLDRLFVETLAALDAAPLLGGLVVVHVTSNIRSMAGASRGMAEFCRGRSSVMDRRAKRVRVCREAELYYRAELAQYEAALAGHDAEVAAAAEGLIEIVQIEAPQAPIPPPDPPPWADLGLAAR